MFKRLRPFFVLVFLCVLLASCRQTSPSTPGDRDDPGGQRGHPAPAQRDPDIFIGGRCSIKDFVLDQNHRFSGMGIPCYWKNGELNLLSVIAPPLGGSLTSLFVSGNDVYASGHCRVSIQSSIKETFTLCYWRNGARTDLHTFASPQVGGATSIFVSGDDVYVSGYTSRRTDFSGANSFPCIWKNGERIELPLAEGFISGSAEAVFVSGSDVYAAGTNGKTGGRRCPCLWKNGVVFLLSVEEVTHDTIARAVFLSGADLIATGVGDRANDPCYWKNGARVDLPLQRNSYYSIAWNSICLREGDSYVPGHFEEETGLYSANYEFPCYWKNGELIGIEREDGGNACAIAFLGEEMVIAGTANEKSPCFWKNGVKTPLPVIDSARGGSVRTILIQ